MSIKKIIKIVCIFFLLISLSITNFSQNPEGFDKMAEKMADKTVPIIKSKQVIKLQKQNKKLVFLDARELFEYKISHIQNAIHIGYDKFDKKSIVNLSKNVILIVYCSVGYRSGKIGKKLREMGYTSVFNLYGGLFDWANNGYPIYSNSKKVNKVHPYNKKWSKWLKPELRSKL